MEDGIAWVRRALKVLAVVAIGWFLWKATWGDAESPRLRLLDAEQRLLHHRIEVLKYWDVKGTLPEVLEDTMSIRGASPVMDWNRYARARGKQCVDPWDQALGYTVDADGKGFEVRSGGPDEKLGTADDIASRGSTTDDRKALYAEYRERADRYERERPKSRKKRTDW